MHAVLLPNSNRILYWGYGQRADQSRLWTRTLNLYQPANQPFAIHTDENIWSGAHAHLADAAGTILVHSGFMTGGGVSADTERRASFSTWLLTLSVVPQSYTRAASTLPP